MTVSRKILDSIFLYKIIHLIGKHKKGNIKRSFQKENDLKEYKQKLNRILTAYENGLYSLEQFSERRKIYDDKITILESELSSLDNQTVGNNNIDIPKLRERIEYFKANWYRVTTSKEKNILLKNTVKKITYDRVGDIVTFEIEYL